MTPTDLQAVRAAADRVKFNTIRPSPAEHLVYSRAVDQLALADYILATIPPDAEQSVTADTLELWGLVTLDGMAWNHKQLTGTFCFEHDALSWWHTGNRTAVISSICQFTQLANALGINKIKRVSKCSNTH